MVTSLAPRIGYDQAAEIAKESAKTGRTVRELCLEKKVLPADELERALDPVGMMEPGGEVPPADRRYAQTHAVVALARSSANSVLYGAATENRIDLAAVISKDAEAALAKRSRIRTRETGRGRTDITRAAIITAKIRADPGPARASGVRRPIDPGEATGGADRGQRSINRYPGWREATLSSEDAEKGRVPMSYVVKGNVFVMIRHRWP